MDLNRVILVYISFVFVNGFVIEENINDEKLEISEEVISDDVPDIRFDVKNRDSDNPANVFNGVYTECFVHLSYTCLQKKTLLYLKELNRLNEISVIGDYVKFVKLNHSDNFSDGEDPTHDAGQTSDELAYMIDKAVDNFFDNHLIRFSALGKDVLVPNKVEEFVGRKKRKGGGGGGGHGGDGDGGKKKMMMMAMMCMKMKLMMMVPAMMGMMGMMSFKGMMFSMMSFMISKMMLLMKILEKKGGGGGGGGGGDGGWAAAGGGGAWMPTGQDYGGGGGYDANGQWQSRSIIEGKDIQNIHEETPVFSYAKPIIKYNINNKINAVKSLSQLRKVNDEGTNNRHDIKSKSRKKRDSSYTPVTNLQWQNRDKSPIKEVHEEENILSKAPLDRIFDDEIIEKHYDIKPKSRKKRGILDVLQNAYLYWMNKILGLENRRTNNNPKYKIINGVKYVYYPVRNVKVKPKELQHNTNVIKETDSKAVIVDDFNKGEIVEGPIESRMMKKFHKLKDNVNETVDMIDDNPWE